MGIITVSDSAITQIKEYFSTHEKEKKPIRIIATSGCGGSLLAITLDESTDKDVKVIIEDFEFIADQELIDLVGNIEIEFDSDRFFSIKSERELPKLGEGCAGCSCRS